MPIIYQNGISQEKRSLNTIMKNLGVFLEQEEYTRGSNSPKWCIKKKKVLLKTFFESQFSYCPLLWMFCSRKLNNKINRLHERALRIAYADYVSSFEELLIKDGSVTIHQRNLKVLATEMYKISHGISPKFMHDLVEEIDTKYHTRSRYGVELDEDGNVKSLNKKLNYRPQKSNTSSFGLESFRWSGSKI